MSKMIFPDARVVYVCQGKRYRWDVQEKMTMTLGPPGILLTCCTIKARRENGCKYRNSRICRKMRLTLEEV